MLYHREHNVTFAETSDVTILPNTTITLADSSSLTINGKCNVLKNCQIMVNGGTLNIDTSNPMCLADSCLIALEGGTVNITDASLRLEGCSRIENSRGALYVTNSLLTFGTGKIDVYSYDFPEYNGSVHIIDSSLNTISPDGRWGGIIARDASDITIENTHIYNAVCGINAQNTNITLLDTNFEIPTCHNMSQYIQTMGVKIVNDVEGKTTQIINSDSLNGFNGGGAGAYEPLDPLDMKTGVFISGDNSPLVIRGATFHNLHCGIELVNSFGTQDSIAYCQFNNCATGIYTLSVSHSGTIQNCRFSQIDSDNQMLGISLELASPAILACEFYNLKGSGILTRQSTNINQQGIYDCEFANCDTGLESYNAANVINGTNFINNETGLLCHAGSNLNLSHTASNVLYNKTWNIMFTEAHPYTASIQLIGGHNDFHHYVNPETNERGL